MFCTCRCGQCISNFLDDGSGYLTPAAIPIHVVGNGLGCATAIDLDRDGALDLLSTNHESGDGSVQLRPSTSSPESDRPGGQVWIID